MFDLSNAIVGRGIRNDYQSGEKTMSRVTSVVCALAFAAACLSSPATAADLPKSGTYSGHYGWTFTGQVQVLGPDRTVYAGVVPGVMFNDEGKGFMHKARA